jgi:hypothetical protein
VTSGDSAQWYKSSFSGDASCVEVQIDDAGGAIHVRDSKNRSGPTLSFTLREWQAFLQGAHEGEFDVPPSV